VQGQLGLAILLETCFLQHWFNLSDPGVEEAFHDSRTFRRWASLDERTQLFRSVLQLQKAHRFPDAGPYLSMYGQ